MSDLYFNEESDYSEEYTNDNEDFRSTILQPFQFDLEQKRTCDNESHEKETKYIHASTADFLHIKIGNLDWCKCGHCQNEAREIGCLCCREVGAMVTGLAKIPERKGSIMQTSLQSRIFSATIYVQLLIKQSLIFHFVINIFQIFLK